MNKKILNKTMREKKLDVIYSVARQTRLWYAKVDTTDGWIFIQSRKADLYVDGRYIEYATKNAKNVKVNLATAKSLKAYAEKNRSKYKRIGIEEDYLTLKEKNVLAKLYPKAKLIPINGQSLRIIKSEEEIKLLKKACSISLKAYDEIKPMIKAGVTEHEIDHQLNLKMKQLGAKKESFDSIVVSGPRGALPHGQPSNKKLKNGELVTVDFGVEYKGYVSDITRTFQVGKVTNKTLLEIEKILIESQRRGIKAVKPGISTFEIDKICRDYITEKGYGENFVHSTGHGVGIDVHELPNVSFMKKSSTILKPGMVITVEPGIYIEGLGGIRLEDDILVTEKGHKILSK